MNRPTDMENFNRFSLAILKSCHGMYLVIRMGLDLRRCLPNKGPIFRSIDPCCGSHQIDKSIILDWQLNRKRINAKKLFFSRKASLFNNKTASKCRNPRVLAQDALLLELWPPRFSFQI